MNSETNHNPQRDRARTSAVILAAATELFLERGYAAVPISLIAKQVNVTKSLIHHHFGDKHGLWLAVKDAAVASYATQQKAVFSSIWTERDEGGVAASTAVYFSFLQKGNNRFKLTPDSLGSRLDSLIPDSALLLRLLIMQEWLAKQAINHDNRATERVKSVR